MKPVVGWRGHWSQAGKRSEFLAPQSFLYPWFLRPMLRSCLETNLRDASGAYVF